MDNHGKTAESGMAGLDLATCSLSDIDKALRDLIEEEKNDWSRYYVLISTVEARELYRPDYGSLTAWLRSFCATCSLSEQRAWQIKRAGKVYQEYARRNEDAPDIGEIEVAPQVLMNIEKAACKRYSGYDYDEENRNRYIDRYMTEALQGNLTRDGSHDLYVRERKKADQLRDLKDGDSEVERTARNTETADAIKAELAKNWHWLGEKKEVGTNLKQTASTQNYYDFLPEFDISTPGEAKSIITADGVIMENLTTPGGRGYTVNVHAIEIKADSYDYQRDRKYTDYRKYSDYLWLAMPESVLLQIDPASVPKYVGVLAFSDGDGNGGKVVEEAGAFLKVATTPDEFGNDQVVIGREAEEDAPALYQVRPAEYNISDDKKTDQLLRHWVVRKR